MFYQLNKKIFCQNIFAKIKILFSGQCWPKLKWPSIYIFIYTLLVCLSVCIKTAEPIGSKIFVETRVTLGKVHGWIFKNLPPSKIYLWKLSKSTIFFIKSAKYYFYNVIIYEENMFTIEIEDGAKRPKSLVYFYDRFTMEPTFFWSINLQTNLFFILFIRSRTENGNPRFKHKLNPSVLFSQTLTASTMNYSMTLIGSNDDNNQKINKSNYIFS